MGILSSLFGIGGSRPRQETVVQSSQIPTELAPFVKQILGEARDLYEAELERGYEPYTGLTSAPFTPEQELAQAGITGLVGTTAPYLEEAVETYREGAEEFTPEVAEEFMSPYQRAVTDIEKREAQRTFERDIMPKFEAEAVRAGGLSGLGSRAGVQAAELQRGQQQLLADIEAKGLQSAYQDARLGFEQQKARERQMAGDVGRTGPALFQAGLAEQGALMGVGEQRQQQAQTALDEAYFRFLEERGFPQQTLGEYSQTVYGNPVLGKPSVTQTTTGTPFVSSPASQLMGLGLSGLNLYGMAGGFSPGGPSMQNLYARPGMPMRAKGGPVIKRQQGSVVGQNTNMNEILKKVFTQLTDPKFGSKTLSPITQKITGDVEKAGYFDPVKRSIPSQLLRTQLENQRKLAKEGSERIATQRKEDLEKIKDPYFEGQEELATRVNVGKGVGSFLKDVAAGKVSDAITPVQIAAGTFAAAGETGGRQIEEGWEKLAEVRKEKYTDDKGEIVREADRLLNEQNLDNATQIELIKNDFSLNKELAKLPLDKQKYVNQEASNQLKAGNLGLARLNTLATFFKALDTSGKGGDKGGKDYTGAMKLMNDAIEKKHGVTLDYDKQGKLIGIKDSKGNTLSNTDPAHIRIIREMELREQKFLNSLKGTKYTRDAIATAQNSATNWAGGSEDPPYIDFSMTANIISANKPDPNNPDKDVESQKILNIKEAIKFLADKHYNGNTDSALAYLKYKITTPDYQAWKRLNP